MRTHACVAVILLLFGYTALGQVASDPIGEHLQQKQFQKALSIAENHDERDQLLGRIALAQLGDGDTNSAKSTFRLIDDPLAAGNATQGLQQAAGGATGADFQTLIDLITTTVEPESWDELGGPGSVAEFPGGVYVDAKGVLQKVQRKADARLEGARAVAKAKTQRDGSRRQAPESDLRMVSLTRLQRELQLSVALGEPISDEMRYLAGLQRIEYVFVFPETNDLVIAGPANDVQASGGKVAQSDSLLLNDLLTLLKNAESNGEFGCSITPKRANLVRTKQFLAKPTGTLKPRATKKWVGAIRDHLGLQDIQVGGINPGSHVAHVLVEADYHMKLIGMGLEPSVPNVPSYLASIKKETVPKSMDVLRWWFTLKPDAVVQNQRGDSFRLAPQVVQLQSENELITDNGNRVHTGQSSDLNRQFAQRFTDHFDELADRHPVYRRLENVFRMALVAALIHSYAVRYQLEWDPTWLTSTLTSAVGRTPQEVPSIVNHRVINRRHVVVGVSGGVRVNAREAITNRKRSDVLVAVSQKSSARPRMARSTGKWWWDSTSQK